MARFDVFELAGGMLVVDCQSDLLRDLQSRFVIPLFGTDEIEDAAPRLNPEVSVDGRIYRLFPQGAATLSIQELNVWRADLSNSGLRIIDAIDVLVSGT